MTCTLLLAATLACARTDLNPGDLETGESREPNTVDDAGAPEPDVTEPDADVEDADVEDGDVEDPDVEDPDVLPPDECEPTGAESCNGVDDDCNGSVDDLPPVACADGGFSYCVRGAMSECPRECQTCMPGSETICFVSYCYFWGVQTCSGDGKSLSGCIEEPPPSACTDIARDHQKSRQLEQCCIDEGYCCKDDFDLDHDGDTRDYVGNCSEVICGGD
ncbi:MAG TPA: hypothetical protein VI197_35385 [Polyangiaceae bacterium]